MYGHEFRTCVVMPLCGKEASLNVSSTGAIHKFSSDFPAVIYCGEIGSVGGEDLKAVFKAHPFTVSSDQFEMFNVLDYSTTFDGKLNLLFS